MKVSPLLSRAAAVILAVAAAGVCIVLPTMLARNAAAELDKRLTEALEARAKLTSIVDNLDRVGDATTPDLTEQYAGDFLRGEEDSLILAELQTRLRAIVVGKKSDLTSARTLPGKTIGTQLYLGLRLQVQGELADIQGVLHSIEYGRPVLFIDRFALRLLERRGATVDDKPPQLFAEIDVFGAKWPGTIGQKTGGGK